LNKSNKNNSVFPHSFFNFSNAIGAECRLRFAPTPSGFLHLGNAVNFTLNWLVARLNGGKILLRIDDLDAARKRPEYVADIFESLAWLELDWDEGPGLLGNIDPVLEFENRWSQHLRLPLYKGVLEQLRDRKLLFPCSKSRLEHALNDEILPEHNLPLTLDDLHVAWRIVSDEQLDLGDFVVRRRDGIPAYQIASFADDVFFRITHVVRGDDLASSTIAQRYIARCLNETSFLHVQFLHHPLFYDSHGAKLSKSAGSYSLHAMRKNGEGPGVVMAKVAQLLGLSPVETPAALLAAAKSIDLNTAPNTE
jgi:glutamyl-tRNA synthetase